MSIDRRSLLAGAAGAALGLSLGACGSETNPGGTLPSPSIAPKKGGRVRAAFIGGSAETLDVRQAVRTPMDFCRARLVYDTLVEIGPGGKTQLVLLDELAPNADGTQWTLRLKKDLTFSDGKKMTIDDILFSLTTYSVQAPLIADMDLKNVSRKDELTAVVPLKRPHGWMDLALSQIIFIIPAGTTDFTKALGSGPYVIEKHAVGQGATLKPNPNFWGKEGPYLDQLELLTINDTQARLNALKAGQIEFAAAVPLTAARAEANNPQLKLVAPEKWEWGNLGASMKRTANPFVNSAVSQAMRFAIDRQAIVRNVTLGFGELGNDLMGMHLPYYPAGLPQRAQDLDKAKSLLTTAGLSNVTVSLRTSDMEYGLVESAVAFADQVRAAGINIVVDKVPAADFLADPKVFVNATFQSANRKPRPFPLDVFYFYGKSALLPFTGMTDEKVESMVSAMRGAVSEDKRKQTVADIQTFMYEQGGDLVAARMPILSAASPTTHDVQSLGYPAYPSLRKVFVA